MLIEFGTLGTPLQILFVFVSSHLRIWHQRLVILSCVELESLTRGQIT